MALAVAIVGSGPAGFYTAEAVAKAFGAEVTIDLIERLPTPYGLIRFGVAPDHQTTKKVMRAFEKTAERPEMAFFGNVEVGRDVTLAELRSLYDAVVLSVGAPFDRPLGVPGDKKLGVIGSASFVGWYNGHPDLRDLAPDLDTEAVAVVGVGNVAIDIARVLVKTPAEMASTDLTDYAARAVQASPVRDVYLIGRRGPVEAKFTNVELREMGELEDAVPVVDAKQLPDAVGALEDDRERRLKERNLATLREFTAMAPGGRRKRVHFVFYASPVAVLGGERVEGLRLERTRVENGRAVATGETFDIPCGLVLPAIGYRSTPVEGAPWDAKACVVPSDDGRVEPGLYVAGWIKRGPTGVISTNRPDGARAAELIKAEVTPAGKPGRGGLKRLLAERRVRVVDFPAWKRIEAAEQAGATPPSPRRKFTRVAEMLAALDAATADRAPA